MTPKTAKNVDLLCENAIEYVCSDKPNVGDHFGGFESKLKSKEEREKHKGFVGTAFVMR